MCGTAVRLEPPAFVQPELSCLCTQVSNLENNMKLTTMTRYGICIHVQVAVISVVFLVLLFRLVYYDNLFSASVQRLAIPSLLEGRDAFVKSQTGTGK